MNEELHLAITMDESGVDGIAFSATLNEIRATGVISRTMLLKWSTSSDEPLVHIFLQNQYKIEEVVLERMKSNPNSPMILSEYDF